MSEQEKIGWMSSGQGTHDEKNIIHLDGFLRKYEEDVEPILEDAKEVSILGPDGNPILKDDTGQLVKIVGDTGTDMEGRELTTLVEVLRYASPSVLSQYSPQTLLNQSEIVLHGVIVKDIITRLFPELKLSGGIGNSVGELVARYAVGNINRKDLFDITGERAKSMSLSLEECLRKDVRGCMYFIAGINAERIKEIVAEFNEKYKLPLDRVNIGGILGEAVTTLSGQVGRVEELLPTLKVKKDKVKIIQIPTGDGAYHHPAFMQLAMEKMKGVLTPDKFKDGVAKIYTNLTGCDVPVAQIHNSLLDQIENTVQLYAGLLNMQRDGVRKLLAVGPKAKEAGRYAKPLGFQIFNISTAADIDKDKLVKFLFG